MVHELIAYQQKYTYALYSLLGCSRIGADPLVLAWGGPVDEAKANQVTALAEEMKRSLLYLAFDGERTFQGASLALWSKGSVRLHADCALFATERKIALSILTPTRAYRLDEHNGLVSFPLPASGTRLRGEVRARCRIEQLVDSLDPLPLSASRFVPAGKSFADAVPTENLRLVQ